MKGLARLIWLLTGGTGLLAGVVAIAALTNPSINKSHALISVASLIGGGVATGTSIWALANMGEMPEMEGYSIAGSPLFLPAPKEQDAPPTSQEEAESAAIAHMLMQPPGTPAFERAATLAHSMRQPAPPLTHDVVATPATVQPTQPAVAEVAEPETEPTHFTGFNW